MFTSSYIYNKQMWAVSLLPASDGGSAKTGRESTELCGCFLTPSSAGTFTATGFLLVFIWSSKLDSLPETNKTTVRQLQNHAELN